MRCGDTSFFVDLFDPDRPHHEDAVRWYDSRVDRPLFAPTVVHWDLYRGAVRVSDRYTDEVRRFMEDVEPVPLTEAAAMEAANVEQETRDVGEQLAVLDCLVAGIVRAVDGTVVTRDRDFDRVDGLDVEYYSVPA